MVPSQKLGFIQALRGIAVALVVLYHFPGAFSVSKTGYVGVDLFFVVSGFIMVVTTAALPGGPRDAAAFVIKRLTRIWPTYAVATLAMAAVFYVGMNDQRMVGIDLLYSLLFYPLWVKGAVDIPGWTLNYEIYFYSLFAISLLLPRGRLLFVAVGITFGQCILPWLLLGKFQPLGPDYGFPADGLNAYLAMFSNKIVWSFLFGSIAGQIAVTGVVIRSRMLAFALAAPSWLLVLYMMYWLGHEVDHGPWYGAAFALGILPLSLHDKIRPLRVPLILITIGNCSYSIYITHWLVARFFLDWWNGFFYASDSRIAAMLLAYAGLISLVCVPTYIFIEVRFSNWIRDKLLSSLINLRSAIRNGRRPTRSQARSC